MRTEDRRPGMRRRECRGDKSEGMQGGGAGGGYGGLGDCGSNLIWWSARGGAGKCPEKSFICKRLSENAVQ